MNQKGTEQISNRYGTVTDQTKGKRCSQAQTMYRRTRSSEHMLVSYAIRVLTRDLKTVQI